ncbi:MAG: flagellar type III secretion system protein FlhB [Rhodocyclaceae bacterium]|nr:flagellar type III secretion system protein FlhB [Rhodocyclaceae bacterium]
MAEESDLEKTEPASSRRIEKAREEGNIPQSRELTAFMVLAAGTGTLWVMGDWFAHRTTALLSEGLRFDRGAAFDATQMAVIAYKLSYEALVTLAPLFLLTIVAAILAPAAVGGFVLSQKAMQFDFGRMDPIKGFGRMFSWQSVAELTKALLKAALIGGVIYWVVLSKQGDLFALILQPVEMGLGAFVHILLTALMAVVGGVAVIALIDVPFQLWQYYDRLKMTREELRQEHKEMEGDPHLKARIRSQQREIARRRMMSEVPKADVVVTNPTHFAVALKYDSGKMAAPQVVAKGMNMVAARIRELAAENGVPIVEAPPLARALHRHTELGDGVPAGLYTAVAEVMAYVYQLNEFARSGGRLFRPVLPENIPVPADLDPGPQRDAHDAELTGAMA